jgi:hypothetical protein
MSADVLLCPKCGGRNVEWTLTLTPYTCVCPDCKWQGRYVDTIEEKPLSGERNS